MGALTDRDALAEQLAIAQTDAPAREGRLA
jgi:hypothetical protein